MSLINEKTAYIPKDFQLDDRYREVIEHSIKNGCFVIVARDQSDIPWELLETMPDDTDIATIMPDSFKV